MGWAGVSWGGGLVGGCIRRPCVIGVWRLAMTAGARMQLCEERHSKSGIQREGAIAMAPSWRWNHSHLQKSASSTALLNCQKFWKCMQHK